MQRNVDVRNIDVQQSAVVEVGDRNVHAFVGVFANAAESFAGNAHEPLSVVVKVKIIRAEIT